LICIAGRGAIAGQPMVPGEVWWLPQDAQNVTVEAESEMRFLRTYAPPQ